MKNLKNDIKDKNQIIGSNQILLSIIIPCFNEINTIEEVIQKVKNSSILNKEIIIVDDYSQDGSREYLENIIDDQIKVKFHKKNQGKGAALKTGIDLANSGFIRILRI